MRNHLHPMLLRHLGDIFHTGGIDRIGFFPVTLCLVDSRIGGKIEDTESAAQTMIRIWHRSVMSIFPHRVGETNGKFILLGECLSALPSCLSPPVTSTCRCTAPAEGLPLAIFFSAAQRLAHSGEGGHRLLLFLLVTGFGTFDSSRNNEVI